MSPQSPPPNSSSSSSSPSPTISPASPPPHIPTLQTALSTNPTYAAHTALISALRQTADLSSLRIARSNFAAQFPLSTSLWVEWLEDELRIAAPEQQVHLFGNLFPTALRDFLEPKIHLMRLQLAIQLYKAGAIPVTQVCDSVEDSWWLGCLHAGPHAQPVWDLYTKFVSDVGEGVQRYVWMTEGTLLDCAATDDDVRAACAVFERKLEGGGCERDTGYVDDQRALVFRSYAAYAKGVHQGMAIAVYERFVREAFADANVWGEYCTFCAQVKRKGFAHFVAARACRNVPWDLWIWRWTVITVDTAVELYNVIHKVTPHVMASDNYAGAEWLVKAIWTMYLMFGGDDAARERLMATLAFNVEGSVNWARACAFAAEMLIAMGKVQHGIDVMDKVVQAMDGQDWCWIQYASIVERAGDAEKVRQVLNTGLTHMHKKWGVNNVADAWLRFECRCEDKRDLRERLAKVNVVVAERLHSVAAVKEFGQRSKIQESEQRNRRGTTSNRNLPKRKRAKRTETKEMEEEKEDQADKATAGDRMDMCEKDERTGAKDRREEQVKDDEEKNDRMNEKGHREGSMDGAERGSKDKAGSGAGGEEPRTVFVNNLPYNTTEDAVRDEFSFAGEIVSVRIPRRSDGASKGIAYVEFAEEEMVERALEKHQKVIMGRSVWVRRSKPPGKKGRRGRGGSARGRGGRGTRKGRGGGRRSRIDVGGDVERGDDEDMEAEAERMDEEVVRPKTQAELRAMFVGK